MDGIFGHKYYFDWETIDGDWVRDEIGGADSGVDAYERAKLNASLFGTGRFLFYGDRLYDQGMFRDETGMLYLSKAAWDRTGSDYKSTHSDINGTHPELRGCRELMPPLSYGYTTCLLVEHVGFVVAD